MALAYRERGERSKLAEHIKTVTENGTDGKPLQDQSLADAAKSTALALIGSLPKEVNGALVIMEVHAGETNRHINVQVIGEKGIY